MKDCRVVKMISLYPLPIRIHIEIVETQPPNLSVKVLKQYGRHLWLSKRRTTFVSLLVTCLVLSVWLVWRGGRGSHSTTTHPPKKLVLFWTQWYQQDNWTTDASQKEIVECGCDMTYDKTRLAQSDAVIFHSWNLQDRVSMPPHATHSQRFVFYSKEPPIRTRGAHLNSTSYNGYFNWTMTYRPDSDVWNPYGAYAQRVKSTLPKNFDWIFNNWLQNTVKQVAKRTGGSVAIISRCEEQKRLDYIKELSKYTPVTLLGTCTGKPKISESELRKITGNHKFFLAFENSHHCRGYITEKYWTHGLRRGLVPVVMGSSKEDYKLFGVPYSYIHVENYKSAQDLATYMNTLLHNTTLYTEYFRWRKKYYTGRTKPWCSLCRKLQSNATPKVYNKFDKWWETCGPN